MEYAITFTLILFGSFYLIFRVFRDVPDYFDNFAQGNSIWDMFWWWFEVIKWFPPNDNFNGWLFGKMIGYKGKRIEK